jgi:hypothetical protein
MRKNPKPKNPGGRPEFRPSVAERQTVEQMKFCGESDNVIARALRIDAHTLRKHFAIELADGYASRRRQVIEMLFKEADGGNVAAIRKLEEMGRLGRASEALESRADKDPKLGKKEEAQQAAERVTGKFATPASPKLVVNNN